MVKVNPLPAVYTGIDASSRPNAVCAMDFYRNRPIEPSFSNSQPGAVQLADKIPAA